MLSAADLAGARATVLASLPDTAQVQRTATLSNGGGGATTTWPTIATVACRLAPAGLTPEERVVAERVGSAVLWRVTLPLGTDVAGADRLVIGARTFEVVGALGPRSEAVKLPLLCAEVL